ncbi:unnamed protein product [Peniophora sp. CBMAI 1063]|nr:unnamed protein product [Peniophora sp. CBMAI 1063]
MFPVPNINGALSQLQRDPDAVIRKAREGGIAEVVAIVNTLQSNPRLQKLDVARMFLHHLRGEAAPDPSKPAAPGSPATKLANLAIHSCMGLGNLLGARIDPVDERFIMKSIYEAWGGIYPWIIFFYTLNTNPAFATPEKRWNTLEYLLYMLYSICKDDQIQLMVSNTDGIVPMVSKLWKMESELAENKIQGALPIPSAAASLHHVLYNVGKEHLPEVIEHAGSGKVSFVADKALSNLRLATKKGKASHMHVHVDVLIAMTIVNENPLQRAMLKRRAMEAVTDALLKLSKMHPSEMGVPEGIIACFGFVRNMIEAGDGTTYVRQAVEHGLLEAFVNVSPFVAMVDPEAQGLVKRLIEDIIPRYLVYRSVIVAVKQSMDKIDAAPENKRRVQQSIMKVGWKKTKDLAAERSYVQERSEEEGTMKYCDNCKKSSGKDAFRKCSGCHMTYYCSKECQVTAWKEKGHKNECKLKGEEYERLREGAISKSDRRFHHTIAIQESVRRSSHLRQLAARTFPTTPLHDLGVKIDFTQVPATFSLFKLSGHEAELSAQINPNLPEHDRRVGEARIEGLVRRAQENAGEMTYIESMISAGRENVMVVSLSNRSVFEEDVPVGWSWGSMEGAEGEQEDDRESEEDEEDEKQVAGWSQSIVGTMKSVLGY